MKTASPVLWKRFTKPRLLLVYPLTVGLFLFAHVTEDSLRVGIALIALGLLLRFWANGYVGHRKVNRTQRHTEAKVGQLITAGPYAFVRHPLYLGTFLMGAGFCLIVRNPWLTAVTFLGFVIVYRKKMDQEDALLLNEWSGKYRPYQAAVPRLIPRGSPYPDRHGHWTWAGVAASKEWKTVLWAIILTILIYFWEESVQEQEWLFDERYRYRMFLLGVLLVLGITDGLAELILRRMKSNNRIGLQP